MVMATAADPTPATIAIASGVSVEVSVSVLMAIDGILAPMPCSGSVWAAPPWNFDNGMKRLA